MNFRWKLLKFIFSFVSAKEARRFDQSMQNPEKSQKDVLQRIIKSFQLETQDLNAFRQKYPISGEGQLPHARERVSKKKIITQETTSGSSGNPKIIPYTSELMNSFHHMFRLWAWDILRTVRLSSGKSFFSISSQNKEGTLQEDSDYLENSLKWLMRPFWAIDATKIRKSNPAEFMQHLSLELLKCRDLEIISVWSPSYFLALLDEIEKNKHSWKLDNSLSRQTQSALSADKIDWIQIWPELKFVSAWGSAMASNSFKRIQSCFSHATFQSKGLLATEAPITIPWSKAGGFVPLLSEVFFEFLDQQGELFLIHELQDQKNYELIISTFGGLFRYRLGDIVKVVGFYKKTPMLDFIGRSGDICDLVGEKLSEQAVRSQLAPFIDNMGYFVLIPHLTNTRYLLYTEKIFDKSALDIDEALRNVFHYDVARKNDQLKPLKVFYNSTLRADYFSWLESRKMRLGDIKERALISNPELAQDFLKYMNTDRVHVEPFFSKSTD